jgi:hypothetical protein
MHEEVHIGKLIRQKLDEKDRSMAWLARKVNCDSSNFCKLLARSHINTQLLFHISIVLEEDFFVYYSNVLKEVNLAKNTTTHG